MKRVFNVRSMKDKKYSEVDLGEYAPILGSIEGKTLIMVYGPSGSGKSVFVLKLVNYLSQKYGKAAYNSCEERTNKTLQNRIKNYNIDSNKLWFLDNYKHEELIHAIQRCYYRVVVIDSIQYMKLTYEQLKELRATFAKRNIILILVSFGKALGQTDGANEHLHASDVKVFIKNGHLTSISRYNDGEYKAVLFNPASTDTPKATTLELFETSKS